MNWWNATFTSNDKRLMQLHSAYAALCLLSFALAVKQLFQPRKELKHILFAVFAGSLALVALKFFLTPYIGPYHHLLAVSSSLTCTSFLFLSRAMFRDHNPLAPSLIILAASVVLCLASNEILKFLSAVLIGGAGFGLVHEAIGSLLTLAASGVKILTIWEACRGFHSFDNQRKAQRIMFIAVYGGAVFATTVLGVNTELYPWMVVFAALLILISIEIIIIWQDRVNNENIHNQPSNTVTEADNELAQALKQKIFTEKYYLHTNLKLANLAQELSVPEYKVSRTLRNNFNAQNFNQFINKLRIEHATQLLEDANLNNWPVLSIGLEAGFASAGPFTRAFKSRHGCTPGEYRQNLMES
jgi:AraC-like DNA-binding protein